MSSSDPLIAAYWIPPHDPWFGPLAVERTGAIVDGEAQLDVDRWAIRRGGMCLGRDGEWEPEPLPSSRTDEWLDAHRYPLDEAISRAEMEAAR